MKPFIGILVFALLSVTATAEITAGKASGSFVVSEKSTPLRYAYVLEKNAALKIALSDQPLDEATLTTPDGLSNAVANKAVSALIIQLDEDRRAEEVFFFHSKLPDGLSVRELSTFKSTISNQLTLGGQVKFDDPGFSFSYQATFQAPISKIVQKIEPLAADANTADHARWRLKQLEIEFDEGNFRDRVIRGDADAVKLFLEAGMPVETAGALTEAVERNEVAVAKVLIAAGANAKAQGPYGKTLIHGASDMKNADMLKLLIDSGADVNIANEYKVTPLSSAAEQGSLEIVRLLIAAGAKVNARDTSGGTALSIAVIRGYQDVVRLLLDAGADVQRDKADLLEYAKDNPEILKMIEEAISKTAKK